MRGGSRGRGRGRGSARGCRSQGPQTLAWPESWLTRSGGECEVWQGFPTPPSVRAYGGQVTRRCEGPGYTEHRSRPPLGLLCSPRGAPQREI